MKDTMVTKTISCPDGISRLVTLDARYWRNLQWLVTMGLVQENQLSDGAWNFVAACYKKDDVRELEFISTFAHMIHKRMADIFPQAQEQSYKNDNRMARPDTKKLFAKISKAGAAEEQDFNFPVCLPMTTARANFKTRPGFQISTSVPRSPAKTSNQNSAG